MLYVSCTLSAPPALLSSLLASPVLKERKEQTGSTTYDQKQSGKYNIHLNIKDVAIIALDGGNTDSDIGDFGEDYYIDYDLSDFTVKPIFGLIDITSEKPSSTAAPALIHSESDSFSPVLTGDKFSAHGPAEEPIIKDSAVNKTQSVVILNGNATPTVSILDHDDSSSSGITVTTPSSSEEIPSKFDSISEEEPLIDFGQTNKTKQSLKPNEIPVQVVIEPVQSTRQRLNGNWRVKNHFRSTPSNIRRITPPHFEATDSSEMGSAPGTGNVRKNYVNSEQYRNCMRNRRGNCEHSRRFSSPVV